MSGFYDRATAIRGVPTLVDHCVVSAKDPRVSARPEIHADVIASIVKALSLQCTMEVLEVGCASGYIACGLAARVGHYTGVDLAAAPLDVARRMKLSNAQFLKADGAALPFPNNSFDAAFVYDVYTNFPEFEHGIPLMREMLRVVKPGGRVMIGSVTNKKRASEFAIHAQEVAQRLLTEYGEQAVPGPYRQGLFERIRQITRGHAPPKVEPQITTYSFDPDDFKLFGESQGARVTIGDVHPMNPYFGFRYNVVFSK